MTDAYAGYGSTAKKLTSERHQAFLDALETLYIRGNISGRLKFLAEWPDVARFIFGEELAKIDQDGTKNKARRIELEGEAEDRRLYLVDIVTMIEEKSAVRSVLQVDYVQGVIRAIGRNIALLIYSDWIVDKFAPAPAEGLKEVPLTPVHKKHGPQMTDVTDVPDSAFIGEPEVKSKAPLPSQMTDFDLEEKQPAKHAPQTTAMDDVRPIDEIRPIDEVRPVETEAPPMQTFLQPEPEPLEDVPPAAAPQPQPEPQQPRRGRLKIFGIKNTDETKP